MAQSTKYLGDIAATKVMVDLTLKEYNVFLPAVSEHLPFDMVAYKDGQFFRIQVKYSSNGVVRNKTQWRDSQGLHTRLYNPDDFDYYGQYLPSIDKVVYPSIKLGGITIAAELPNSATPFYWWKDFINFTDAALKHSFKEFGIQLKPTQTEALKVARSRVKKMPKNLTKEQLEHMLWTMPTMHIAKQFNVVDTTINNWAKHFGLTKPPRGYWRKPENRNWRSK